MFLPLEIGSNDAERWIDVDTSLCNNKQKIVKLQFFGCVKPESPYLKYSRTKLKVVWYELIMSKEILTWIMPIMTATVVSEYKVSSVRDATVMAASCNPASFDEIKTKKTMREIIVQTITKMPQNRPLLALEQSTEY